MAFWRRGEPLHERLAREGGLVERPPHDPGPHWGEVGIHGVHRQRVWDAVATVEDPGLDGTDARFAVLADGRLLSETEALDVGPLAEALSGSLAPPYRAESVRRPDGLWVVAGRRIQVVELVEEIDGDELVLTLRDGSRTLAVDGSRVFGGVPTLERLATGDAVVNARRLEGPLWEVEVAPL